MKIRVFLAFLLGLFFGLPLISTPGFAQVPPSAQELAQYRGLFAAAARGDGPETMRLLAAGESPGQRDGHDRTPYLVAAHQGHAHVMHILIKGGADPRAKDHRQYDAITIAAVRDDPDTVSAAIGLGGDPGEITSPYRGTALIAAAHLGHDEVVRRLIAAGAPLDHINNLGWTALIEAVILGDGGPRHVASAKALVKAGARRDLGDMQGRTPLDHARSRGYARLVMLLEKQRG